MKTFFLEEFNKDNKKMEQKGLNYYSHNNVISLNTSFNDKTSSKNLGPVYSVIATFVSNNTFLAITRTDDIKVNDIFVEEQTKILWSISAAACGFRGKAKAAPAAARSMGELAALKLKSFGIENIAFSLYGTKKRPTEMFLGLLKCGLIIKKITAKQLIPHNGARRKKKRRK